MTTSTEPPVQDPHGPWSGAGEPPVPQSAGGRASGIVAVSPGTAPAGSGPARLGHRWRGWALVPTLLLGAAALSLLLSIFLPYWRMTLHAPQYPKGLHIQLYVNRITGDVAEIDGLNHYIGMAPLGGAALFERSVAIIGIAILALLLLAAVLLRNRWAALLALPGLLYPAIFLIDLFYWLNRFGHTLDPRAPLSTSIKPFTPTILGEGHVGQFRTTASLDSGYLLALAAAVLIVIGLYLHRRAYRRPPVAHWSGLGDPAIPTLDGVGR